MSTFTSAASTTSPASIDTAGLSNVTQVPTAPSTGPSAARGASGLHRRIFPTALGPVAVRYSPEPPGSDRADAAADVYLHGAAGSWTTFIPLLAASAAADERYPGGARHTVLMDLPCWGESTRGTSTSSLTITAMTEAVTGILLTLGYRRWNLIGHSMGGFLALDIAAAEPMRAASVAVISGATFSVATATSHPLSGLLRFPAFTGMLLVLRTMAAWGPAGEYLVRRIGRSALMRPLMSPFFAHPKGIDRDVIAALGEDARPAAFAAAARGAAGYDFSRWRGITAPVLAVRGHQDVFTPPSDLTRLAQLVPQARLVTVPGCGHFAPIEQPGLLAGLLAGGSAVGPAGS